MCYIVLITFLGFNISLKWIFKSLNFSIKILEYTWIYLNFETDLRYGPCDLIESHQSTESIICFRHFTNRHHIFIADSGALGYNASIYRYSFLYILLVILTTKAMFPVFVYIYMKIRVWNWSYMYLENVFWRPRQLQN